MFRTWLLYGMLFFGAQQLCAQENADQKFDRLTIELPDSNNKNTSSYINFARTGNLIFLAGKGPLAADGSFTSGKVGSEVSLSKAKEAARNCAVFQLAVLKKELGSLSRIKRIIKVTGFVNSAPGFYEHSKVMDGFSELLIEIFGESGKHARTSVGVVSLPNNWSVEADIILELADE